VFGHNNGSQPNSQPGRPKAADVARIDGTFTQVILGDDPTDAHVFINGRPLAAGDLDSLTVEIVAPGDGNPGTISGILSSYQAGGQGSEGSRPTQTMSLFPGTVDVVSGGRRVVVTCRQLNSVDGVWLGVGTRLDGTVTEVTGVQAFRVAVTPTFIDATLTWGDTGAAEPVLVSG
jgi:hypothetical protein